MIGLPLAEIETQPDPGPDLLSEAAFELSSMDTFVGNWARNSALEELEKSGRKLSPEELNEKYKDVEVPFSRPMSEVSAFHLNEEGIKRKKLKEAMASAPGSDFYKGAVNISQGLLAHAMDPVEMGTGIAAGWAFRLGGFLMSKAASPGISAAGQALSKQGFAYEAVEGIAGNVALEPFMMASAERAQVEYSIQDSLINVVGGGVAFPALKYVGGKTWDITKTMPSKVSEIAMKSGLGQIYAGKKPDVAITKEVFDDMAYKVNPDAKLGEVRSSYQYMPKTAEEMNGNKIFIASKQAGTLDGGSKPIGDLRFGDDGLYITDNPNAANNIAAHPLDTDGPPGDVFQADLNDIKLLDLDTTGREVLDEMEMSADMRMALDEADDVLSAYQILTEVVDETGDDTIMKEFMEGLRASGFDGFKYSDDIQGHNSAYIFPASKKKIVAEGMHRADPEAVKGIDHAKMDKFRDKVMSDDNDLHHDPQLKKEMESFEASEDIDVAKLAQETLDEKLKVLDALEKEGVITDKQDLALLQKFKENKVKSDKQVKVIEDFADCLLSGAD